VPNQALTEVKPGTALKTAIANVTSSLLATRFQRDHGRPPTPVEAAGARLREVQLLIICRQARQYRVTDGD
jgi:hypothetical protein